MGSNAFRNPDYFQAGGQMTLEQQSWESLNRAWAERRIDYFCRISKIRPAGEWRILRHIVNALLEFKSV
jgi:hypothetical protein